jgi:dynein heavy chain
MGELYGEINPMTREWTPGLISSIAESALSDTSLNKKWIIFDGPVDALWHVPLCCFVCLLLMRE